MHQWMYVYLFAYKHIIFYLYCCLLKYLTATIQLINITLIKRKNSFSFVFTILIQNYPLNHLLESVTVDDLSLAVIQFQIQFYLLLPIHLLRFVVFQVWFLCLMTYQPLWVNAKAIIVEEQYLYYLTHNCERVHTFRKAISTTEVWCFLLQDCYSEGYLLCHGDSLGRLGAK